MQFLGQNLVKNQEHLVQLGEMAASVAHELRNPLGIIKGTNSLIQKKYGSKEDEVFSYIPDELIRLNKLIEDFLAFARTRDLSLGSINLRELVKKILLGFSDKTDIEFKFEISEDFPEINSDGDALEQILLNIIRNSVQACTQNGKIIIICDLGLKDRIKISISDNGPGIPNEIIDRIFDPFFTTRDKGSGLGLAISKRLLDQLDGDIDVRSAQEEGTTVTISLPN